MTDIRPAESLPPRRRDEGIRQPPPVPAQPAPRAGEEPVPEPAVSLVGHVLEEKRPWPVLPVVFLLIALALAALAAATRQIEPFYIAIYPAFLGAGLLAVRRRPFQATFTADGLEVKSPPLRLLYAQIQEIARDRRARGAFAIDLMCSEGFCTIPAKINHPSEEVYRFLASQPLGLVDDRSVPPLLENYLRLQENLFGKEHIRVLRSRRFPELKASYARLFVVFAALFLTGLCWAILDPNKANSGWRTAGITFAIIGGLFAFIFFLAGFFGTAHGAKFAGSHLVLSPGGLALLQGRLRGELKWREIQKITLRSKRSIGGVVGPALTVAGATIPLLNIYDRPPDYVYQLLMDYWENAD